MKQLHSTPAQFAAAVEHAKAIIKAWPKWKRETRASQYPRENRDE